MSSNSSTAHKLKSRDEIINEILESVVGKTKEAVLKLQKYEICETEKKIHDRLFARQDRVASPRPPPNQNGTASNEIGDGDGGVNNEIGTYIIQKTYPINTLVAPFNPEAVLPRLDYSMTKQNYIKFLIMEPKPNNSSTSYDVAVKLGLSVIAGSDFNTPVSLTPLLYHSINLSSNYFKLTQTRLTCASYLIKYTMDNKGKEKRKPNQTKPKQRPKLPKNPDDDDKGPRDKGNKDKPWKPPRKGSGPRSPRGQEDQDYYC
ncbi:unnamed protein product [Rhizophagus irregularis]|nr:unnamed protein product [Rhizophagus irregularis]CAB5186269.1 unnamed protein product [Rhizophagus irregularis]